MSSCLASTDELMLLSHVHSKEMQGREILFCPSQSGGGDLLCLSLESLNDLNDKLVETVASRASVQGVNEAGRAQMSVTQGCPAVTQGCVCLDVCPLGVCVLFSQGFLIYRLVCSYPRASILGVHTSSVSIHLHCQMKARPLLGF